MNWTRMRRGAAIAAACISAFGIAAGSASAHPQDAGGKPVVIKEIKQPLFTTSSAVTPGRSYACGGDGTVRNSPGNFAIGWCRTGTHIDISSSSVSGSQKGWVHGNFDGCGWFLTVDHPLSQEGTYDHNCGSVQNDIRETDFATQVCDSGCSKQVASCPRYLNVSPWVSGRPANDQIASTNGGLVNWRYKTKDGRFVMARYPDVGAGATGYDWAFIPASCVGTPSNARPAQSNNW